MLGALCSTSISWLYVHAATSHHAPEVLSVPGTAIKEVRLSQNTFGYLIPYDSTEIHQQPAAPLLNRFAERTLEADKNSFVMLSFDVSKLCEQYGGNHTNFGNILILRPLNEQPAEIIHLPTAKQSGLFNENTNQSKTKARLFHDL